MAWLTSQLGIIGLDPVEARFGKDMELAAAEPQYGVDNLYKGIAEVDWK